MTNNTLPRFGAIIIGDEILSGNRQDAHLNKIISLLTTRGLSLSWAEYLGLAGDAVQHRRVQRDAKPRPMARHRHQPGLGLKRFVDDILREIAA